MKTPRLVLSIFQWLVYGICVADGICIVRDLTFLGKIGGNLMTGLFFVILALRLWCVWRERDRNGMIRLRNYALGVLCLSLLFLTVWLLLWSSNRLVYEAALYLLILVSAPLPSCSVLFLPVLGWALLLVSAWTVNRKWKRESRKKRPEPQ